MKILTLVLPFFVAAVNAQVTLINTDFQSGIPASYSIIDNDGLTPDLQVSEYSDAWIVVSDPENPNDTVASSTSFFSPVGTANRWLITPQLNLGSFGNLLQWEAKSQDASYPDDYLVLISHTNTDLLSFTDTVGYVIGEDASWVMRQVDLSAEGYNDSSIYLAFVNVTEDGFKLYLDDIKVWKDDPSGIGELEQSALFSVFPNPTTDWLTVHSTEKFESIDLLSLNGSPILTSSNNNINLMDISKGVYLIRVNYTWGYYTKRVIKN
jgi:hypothetical protein